MRAHLGIYLNRRRRSSLTGASSHSTRKTSRDSRVPPGLVGVEGLLRIKSLWESLLNYVTVKTFCLSMSRVPREAILKWDLLSKIGTLQRTKVALLVKRTTITRESSPICHKVCFTTSRISPTRLQSNSNNLTTWATQWYLLLPTRTGFIREDQAPNSIMRTILMCIRSHLAILTL